MKITKETDGLTTIDAGLAGTISGDNILIRAVARQLESEAKGECREIEVEKEYKVIEFEHELDGILTI